MSPCQKSWSIAPAMGRGMAAFLGALAVGIIVTPCAQAQDAGKILKAMSDYVTVQKNASISFDSDIEVVTSELQKIQFTSSGQVLLSRPDKVRATRTGGYLRRS
jgi:hypothetical protein